METELRKLKADAERLEREMAKKQLEIENKKTRAKQQHAAGNQIMAQQYVAEATLLKSELEHLSESRTHTLALKATLEQTSQQMRLDQSVANASSALSKANKLGSSRKGRVDKAVANAAKQLSSISSSSSSSAAFLDDKIGNPANIEFAQELMDEIRDAELADMGLVLPDAPMGVVKPPAAAQVDDFQRRLDKLKG
jgi:hypothetical protein